MTETALALRDEGMELPDRATVERRLVGLREFQKLVQSQMVKDHDYGVIPGTQKPTLLKPGAEKLIKLMSLADTYEIERTEDWDKGFFAYTVRCLLTHMGSAVLVSSGLGECNSMETKYRWRWVFSRDLPPMDAAHKEHLIQRPTRNGGTQYRLPNDEIYSQVNTILKMAKKRALVDAALSAGRLSDLFTQDLEDLRGPVVEHQDAEDGTARELVGVEALEDLVRMAADLKVTPAQFELRVRKEFGVRNPEDMTPEQAVLMANLMQAALDKRDAPTEAPESPAHSGIGGPCTAPGCRAISTHRAAGMPVCVEHWLVFAAEEGLDPETGDRPEVPGHLI